MAKLEGLLKLVGTLEGLTIYKTQDGYVVRKKWGPSAARLKSDPAYKAVRQHQTEFGACTKAAKLLRDSLMPVLEGSIDNRVSSRLNKVMSAVKNLDASSVSGKRKVSKGFATEKGQRLIQNFEFNIASQLDQLLRISYTTDRRLQKIQFKSFVPSRDVRAPKGATHMVLQCGFVILDFDGKKSSLKEQSVVLPLTGTVKALELMVKQQSKVKGLKVMVLKAAFLQEVNGRQMELNQGQANAVKVVDAWI